jgi:hypothetical protein
MSVIAWDGKTLAADRQATRGGTMTTSVKIFKVDDRLFGLIGPHASSVRLYNWLLSGMNPVSFPKDLETDSDIPIVYVVYKSGHVVKFEDSPYPIIIKDEFWADGSGGDLALGAMAMGATAEEAIGVASKYNIYCGCGIDRFSFDE